MTKEEILKILTDDKPLLQKQFKVSKIALFGSYARGDQRQDSDNRQQRLIRLWPQHQPQRQHQARAVQPPGPARRSVEMIVERHPRLPKTSFSDPELFG